MRTVLLTWNGSRSAYPEYDDDIDETQNDEPVTRACRLDTGVHLDEGDRAFLLRTGREPGLMAGGFVLAPTGSSPPASPTRAKARGSVPVVWHTVLDPDAAVTLADLRGVAPAFGWDRAHRSGVVLDPTVAVAVERAWDERLAALGLGPLTDEEAMLDDAVTAQVTAQLMRETALDQVMTQLEAEGYTLTPPPEEHAVDLVATRGDDTLLVLVKPVLPDDDGVLLDRDEVLFARAVHPAVTLAVVEGIDVTTEEPTPGTVSLVRRWDPDDGELEPVLFRYRPTITDSTRTS